MLCQFTPEQAGQITLADLPISFPKSVYPVGRLDADSEGLLFLTDDKSLNYRLLNPKKHVPKVYLAQVEGIPLEQDLDKLRKGVDISVDGKIHRTRTAKIQLLEIEPALSPREPPIRVRKSVPDSWIEITITEGKNRQVRRMCAAIGFPVLRLVRIGIGNYRVGTGVLSGLKPGAVRKVERFD